MTFAHPLLLLLVPGLLLGGLLLHRWSIKLAAARLALFAPATRQPALTPALDSLARARKSLVFLAILILLIVALARPLWGPRPGSADRAGAEYYIILDISNSMLARDVEPDRLEAVKRSLDRWLRNRAGDRIGLILAAGDAFVQAPPTSDHTALREVLRQSGPGAISLGGTNLAAAVMTAAKALKHSAQEQKIAVLISDGENLDGDALEALQQARSGLDGKFALFTVGVGTEKGAPVPEFRKNAPPDYSKPPPFLVRDEYGIPVQSRLDERTLRALAQAGGGEYFRFDPDGNTWDVLCAQALEPLAKKVETLNTRDYIELFPVPLLPALLLLLWEMFIPLRRRHLPPPSSIVTLPKPAAAPAVSRLGAGILAFLIILEPARTQSLLTAEDARRMVSEGRAEEAAAALREASQKNPGDIYALYNYGVAAYASGQFLEASQAFSAAAASPDKRLAALAALQLGNAHYRLGQTLAGAKNSEGAIVAWERAVAAFQDGAQLGTPRETRHNLDVCATQLETVLLQTADQRLAQGRNSGVIEHKANALRDAVDKLQKAAALKPSNQSTSATLVSARAEFATALTQLARDLRQQAVKAAADPKTKYAIPRLQDQARQSYEEALAVDPGNQALIQEYAAFKNELAARELTAARSLIDEAASAAGKNPAGTFVKRTELLTAALGKIDAALAFDPGNAEGAALHAETLAKLEQTRIEAGDLHKAAREAFVSRGDAAGALFDLDAAQKNYAAALAIEPDNAAVAARQAEVQASLAAAYAAAGQKEMESADVAADPKKQIGHLEKAAQSFAQSEALAPGQNNASALTAQAGERLAQLRSQLGAAQNQSPGESPQPSTAASKGPRGGAPEKPLLGFSEIRGSSEREGQFRDKSKGAKIRNW